MSHEAENRQSAQTRVFLSYSRVDSDFLHRLQAGLAARGYAPIFDRSSRDLDDPNLQLSAEDEWWRQLQTMIAAADVMVFIVTPRSAASRVCDDEIAYAKELGKRIIPILRRDTDFNMAPERLRALNVKLDFRDDGESAFKRSLAELIEQLEQNIDWRRRGAHFARLAQKWDAEGRPEAQLLRTGAISDADSWAARRPGTEPAPGPILLAFLDAGRAKEKEDSDARRRLIQRGFAAPARAALADGRADAALRLAAAGALMSEDLDFSLDADAEEPHRFALWRSALRCLQSAPAAVLRGHESQVHRVAFSPDGARILTAAVGEIRVWDAATGAEIGALPAAEGAAFSRDGARLLMWHHKWSARLLNAATCEQIAQLRVGGDFSSVQFSPDGARILTADSQTAIAPHTVLLWDGKTGAQIATLRGHERRISEAAFGPEGKRILTASVDGTARLWDGANGAEIAVLRGHSTEPDPHFSDGIARGWIQSIAFSSEGARALTGSHDATVRIWDAANGAEIAVLRGHTGKIASAAFSGDGRRVLTSSTESGDLSARLWDATTGGEIATLCRSGGYLNEVEFSPNGARVATSQSSGADHVVRLWNGETGAEVAVVRQSDQSIGMRVAFSADGKRMLLDLSEDQDKGAIHLFDGETGLEVAALRGHKDKISAARFSPDGKRLLTGSNDGTARLWDAETGALIKVCGGHEDKVRCVAFSGDGTRIATGGDDRSARVWHAATADIATLRGAAFAFSPDGAHILTGYGRTFYTPQPEDRCARLWDAATGAQVAVLRAYDMSWVDGVAFSPDGKQALTASRDGAVRIWDVSSSEVIATIRHDENRTTSPAAAFSANGARVITACGRIVRFCDAVTGAEVATLRGPESFISGVAMSRDGTRMLTRHFDQSVRVWDAAAGVEIAAPCKGATRCAALSPDGGRLLAVGAAGDVGLLWDIETGAKIAELRGAPMEAAVFSFDGARLLTGGSDFSARVWDAATGAEIVALHGHQNRVLCVAFSPDGTRALTGSADQTARLWDAETGAELATLSLLEGEATFELSQPAGEITCVGFSPDGARVATGGADGMSRLWDVAWSKSLGKDRLIALAAALDCGLGRRSAREAADILMRDAPNDLFAALLERMMAEQRSKVAEASRVVRAPRHPNCYRAPGRRVGYWDKPR